MDDGDLDGFIVFCVLAFAATPVSIVIATHLTGNGPLALGLFIFFGLPALITLGLGMFMQQGIVRTVGTALVVSVMGGGLTLIAVLTLLNNSGALS